MVIFNSYVKLPEGILWPHSPFYVAQVPRKLSFASLPKHAVSPQDSARTREGELSHGHMEIKGWTWFPGPKTRKNYLKPQALNSRFRVPVAPVALRLPQFGAKNRPSAVSFEGRCRSAGRSDGNGRCRSRGSSWSCDVGADRSDRNMMEYGG